MKFRLLAIAPVALASSLAFAQTPTTPSTSDSAIPYIPLFGSTGAGNAGTGTTSSTTWFIDVANNSVVICSQPGADGSAQGFTCSAQQIPTATTGGTPSTPGVPSTGSPSQPSTPQ